MTVLEASLKLFRLLRFCDQDFSFQGSLNPFDIVHHIFAIFSMGTVVCGTIAFCILEAKDLITILGVSYMVVGIVTYIIIFCTMIANRWLIQSVLNRLEAILLKR